MAVFQKKYMGVRDKNMIIFKSSPNKHGSSNLLAERFIQGAEEVGHAVNVIDTASANLQPCSGGVQCGYEGPCVQKDDMDTFRKQILSSDMMVFVTQIKILVDRFCAINSSINRKHMK